MSPFVTKQVLPILVAAVPMGIGFWIAGPLGVFRTAGILVAAGNLFMIAVFWRPASKLRGRPLYTLTVLFGIGCAMGVFLAGPMAPWLVEQSQRH